MPRVQPPAVTPKRKARNKGRIIGRKRPLLPKQVWAIRQVSALKRDGVIELKGKRHVTVPDFERLLAEAGDDSDGGMLA